MTLGCMVLLVKGAGYVASESSAYHKVTDISKSSQCERSDMPGCCCSRARFFFFTCLFFGRCGTTPTFCQVLIGFQKRQCPINCHLHFASALLPAEGQVSTEEEKFQHVLLNT